MMLMKYPNTSPQQQLRSHISTATSPMAAFLLAWEGDPNLNKACSILMHFLGNAWSMLIFDLGKAFEHFFETFFELFGTSFWNLFEQVF